MAGPRINIVAVPPWEVRSVAEYVWPLLVRACSRGCDLPPESFVDLAADRKAVLWLACRDSRPLGVCVTRKELGVDGVVTIFVSVVGGMRFREWLSELRRRVHEFRRAEGASHLVWKGRKGWARVFGLTPLGMDELGYWIFEDYG